MKISVIVPPYVPAPATKPIAPTPNPAFMPDDPAYALGLVLVGAGFKRHHARLWTRMLKGVSTEVWIHRATRRVRIYENPGGQVEVSFEDAIAMAQRGDL